MDLFDLTRELIDIESFSGNERQVGDFLYDRISALGSLYGGVVERMEVAPNRFNVFARWGNPTVTLSTHMDTVPPYIPFHEDDEYIWGRGACDAKGIAAAMISAAEGVLAGGTRNIGLLFVVGEERNSAGAMTAAKQPRGSRYLINGEPTENKLALGSKGALRYELISSGKMAHSAYPELGESAIEKLLDVLGELRTMPLPVDPILGPSTLNIGTIKGGRAPNMIPDSAGAEVMIRLVNDPGSTREAVSRAAAGRVEAREVLCIPALHLGSAEGFETTVVAYTTDIPAFEGAWGTPFLLGPGTIRVAHTLEERVEKRQLVEAAQIYQRMVGQLLAQDKEA
ncbi:MAG: M20/M25/M40 family metallo-hydrolase [Bryobacteraceae bacterium]